MPPVGVRVSSGGVPPSANSSTILAQNAGRSSGLRLLTSPLSVTTSWSTQFAPALVRSVRRLGQEVMVRPRTTSASTSVHGPWQITPTGLPASKNALTNRTASGSVRRKSGFATPPGRTRPSYAPASASSVVTSTWYCLPWSRWLKAWIVPDSMETSSTWAPAFSTASRGLVYSTSSTPSAARKAMRLP